MASTAELAVLLKVKDEASRALGGISGKVGGLNDKLKGLAKVGLLAAGGGLVATGLAALKFGGDFDKAFDQI
ncbi:MAG: hypothetical protein ACE5IZ_09435, partial [Dehalococcoidia bacterium]